LEQHFRAEGGEEQGQPSRNRSKFGEIMPGQAPGHKRLGGKEKSGWGNSKKRCAAPGDPSRVRCRRQCAAAQCDNQKKMGRISAHFRRAFEGCQRCRPVTRRGLVLGRRARSVPCLHGRGGQQAPQRRKAACPWWLLQRRTAAAQQPRRSTAGKNPAPPAAVVVSRGSISRKQGGAAGGGGRRGGRSLRKALAMTCAAWTCSGCPATISTRPPPSPSYKGGSGTNT
jgi:hypothetical protein